MADQITISQITNAFTPAKEISDADKFAGRAEYVKDSLFGLLTDGSNLAIVGGRGIGKSSLARQIINISQGDNTLLEKLDTRHQAKLDFLSFYLACGNNIKNINDLLVRLLTTRDCLLDWIYDIPNASKELEKLRGGLNAGFAKGEAETVEVLSIYPPWNLMNWKR